MTVLRQLQSLIRKKRFMYRHFESLKKTPETLENRFNIYRY